MKPFRSLRKLRHTMEDTIDFAEKETRVVLRNIGWVSAGIAVLAVSVAVGRELRQRYKFHRRTPYDMYSHSGDMTPEEFGMGV